MAKKQSEKGIKPASAGSETLAQSMRRVQQAYPRLGVPVEDLGWRRLTQDSDRDLNPLTQDRMIEIAYYLYQANPLAHWILETTKDFVVGEGITLSADHPEEDAELQDVLDEFWFDPINNFPLWQEDIVRELGLYGELCLPAFVNEATGRVRLSCVDPELIQRVIRDPDNARIAIGVAIKKSLRSRTERTLRIIYDGEETDLFTKPTQRLRAGFTDGECFYFTVNKISTATRGISDLLHLTDWLDGYDQFLFDMAERAQFLNGFIWDVLLEGADGPTIQDFLSKNPPPRRGSVRAHNEKVKWEAVAPDMKYSDSGEGARILRNHILGGAGFPEHWFGGGGDVNRAAAAEMGDPSFKRLSSRQKRIKYIFEAQADYQISRALAAGRLQDVSNPYAYSVNMPEMVSKDLSRIGAVIQQLASALMIAQQQGWVDQATALKIFSLPISQLGTEINLKDVAQKAAAEKENKAAQDYLKPPNPATAPAGLPAGQAGVTPISQAKRWKMKRRAAHG